MSVSHEPWLVVLSLLVAFQGSFVGLHLTRRIRLAQGAEKRVLITSSALTLSLGIWSMHFVGMLAAKLPVAVDFLVLPTLLSFLVCVLVVGFAVYAVGTRPASRPRAALSAVFMGGGIVTMHYIGMYALHSSAHMTHDVFRTIASIVIGITASGFSLWFGFGEGARRSIALSAILMGLAISAMHYTAMSGLTLMVHEQVTTQDMPVLTPGLLAIVVSVVAFVVSGLFFLMLIPEQQVEGPVGTVASLAPFTASAATPVTEPVANAENPVPSPDDLPNSEPARPAARSLPIEVEGRRQSFDSARLVAVQAQAHYTNLFDGENNWFCPLPISEVEAILDPAVFARVHRSHIINLTRVTTIRRAADSDVVAMSSRVPYQAPVSRSRRVWLKQQLDGRAQSV